MRSEEFQWVVETNDLITDATEAMFEDGEKGICIETNYGNIALTVGELKRLVDELNEQ